MILRRPVRHLQDRHAGAALNEESERRALDGELAGLEAAWREADEIARIAAGLTPAPKLGSRRKS
jgi:hypothetical protein